MMKIHNVDDNDEDDEGGGGSDDDNYDDEPVNDSIIKHVFESNIKKIMWLFK